MVTDVTHSRSHAGAWKRVMDGVQRMEYNEWKTTNKNQIIYLMIKGFIRCPTFAVLFSWLNTMAVTLERGNKNTRTKNRFELGVQAYLALQFTRFHAGAHSLIALTDCIKYT